MKTNRKLGLFLSAFIGVALGALTAQAQTNFVWTNALSANWSTNSVAWSNEQNTATTPAAGGLSNWVINFNYNGATTTHTTTNDLGQAAPNGFRLGQLNFNSTAAVNIWGSNLVFQTMNGGLLPSLNQYGPSNAVLNVGVALSNNTTFGGTGTGAVFLNSNLFGNGAMTMNGANYTVIIAQTNYALGGQTINAGTLQIGNGAAIGAVTGNITNNAAGTLVFYRSDSPAITNVLVGAGTNIFRGTGTASQSSYTLNGANLETGPIVIDRARVMASSQATLGNAAYIVATNKASFYNSTAGATFTNTIFLAGRGWVEAGTYGAIRLQSGTYLGNMVLLSNTMVSSYSGAGNYAGNFSGNYELEFWTDAANPNGGKLIVVSSTNSTVPYIRISTNATVALSNDTALGAALVTMGGGYLGNTGSLTRVVNNNIVVSNFFGTAYGTNMVFNGSVNMVGAGRNFVVSNSMTTINGTISNGTVLTNAGPGVLVLNGANTFSGGVILKGGTLGYTVDANLGGATTPMLFSNGVLQVLGGVLHNLGAHPINATSFNGGFDIASPFNAFVVTTNLSGAGGLAKLGPGTLVLDAASTYSGITGLTNGVLRLAAGNNTLATNSPINMVGGTLDLVGNIQTSAVAVSFLGGSVRNGSLFISGTTNFNGQSGWVSANLQGGVGPTKTTTGMLTLLGSNTYSGATLLSNGTLSIVQDANLGDAANGFTLAGGTLQVQGTAVTNFGNHVINASTFTGGIDVASAANVFTITNNLNVGPMTKNGPGTLNLAGVVDMNGATWTATVNAGNLILGGGLQNGTLTKSGASILIVTGTNTVPITVSGGTLQIGNGGTSGALGGTITNNSTLAFLRSDAYTVTNVILGTGIIRQYQGSGQLTFTTNLTAGNLQISSGDTNDFVIFATGSTNFVTGAVSVGGGLGTTAGFGPSGKAVISNGAAIYAGNLYMGDVGSFSGEVVQAGGLVVITNQVRVGHYPFETSTYTMNDGRLLMLGSSGSNPFGAGEQSGTLYLGIDGSGRFIQNGGLVSAQGLVLDNRVDTPGIDLYQITGGSLVLSNWGIQGNNSTLVQAGGGSITAMASHVIARPVELTNINGNTTWYQMPGATVAMPSNLWGNGALVKDGGGLMLLSGSNTYTGGTIINDGLMTIVSSNSLSVVPTQSGVLIGSGGALTMSGPFSNANAWLASGDISTNSTGALALTTNSANESITLAGTAYSNLFVGASASNTVIYNGTLSFNNNDYRLGGGGGTLVMTNNINANSLTVGLTNTTLNTTLWLGGNNIFTNGVVLNNNNTLSVAGEQNLGSANPNLTVYGGTLQIRGAALQNFNNFAVMSTNIAGNFALDINNPGNTFSIPMGMTLGGTFTKLGTGTLVLGGSNNIAGNVTISAGVLRLMNGEALDGAGSNVTVVSGAALQLQGGITNEVGDQLTLNGAGLANDGALRSLSGSNVWNGPVVLGSASRINADADQLTLAAGITNGANILTVGGAGNVLINGPILGGSGNLIKDGSGTLTLTSSNTFTGSTFVNGGTLVADFSAAGAPLTNIINYGSAPTINLNVGNGTFKMISSSSQINTQYFNALVLDTTSGTLAGNATVIATNTGSGASILIFTNNLTRASGGGVVNFILPGGSGRIGTVAGGFGTNTSLAMSGFVTVEGKDFATLGANYGVLAYTAYTNVPAGGTILSATNSTAANVRLINGGAGDITLAAGATSIQNLLVTNTAPVAINVGAGNTLRLGGASGVTGNGVGGLLLAPSSGGLTIGTAINSGYLSSSYYLNNQSSDLVVINNSASNLDINSSVVNGGSGALTLTIAGTGTGSVNLNGTNSFTGGLYVNSSTVNLSNTNSLTGAVVLRGGSATFTSTSSNSLGAVTINSGCLTINGPTTLGGNNMTLGGFVNERAVVVINTNAVMNKMLIGAGAAGATIQNGGAVSVGSGLGATEYLSMGSGGGYGYYQMNGGTLLSGQFSPGGSAANGVGVFDQLGGATTVNGQWFIFGWGATGRGVVNLFNGTMAYATNWANPSLGYTANGNSFGMINLLGSSVVLDLTGGTNAVVYVDMMRSAGNLASVINLNGGTLIANQIKATSAGASLLNFNGGTLLVNTNTAFSNNVITGLTAATIYSGGATIDVTNNANVIIPQNLSGPTGFGVTNIALAYNGAGYIGAPAVLITGGSGTGMTAVAQMNLASGTVTNLLITSAGSGYLPDDTVNIQLLGGGYTQAAILSNVAWAANQNSGGLTMQGSGNLTLTGTNGYGGTTVNNGAGNLIFQPSAVTTNSIGGFGGAGAIQHNGPGLTILNGSSAGFTGAATINTGTVLFANLGAVPVNTNVTVNAAGTVALDFGGGDVQTALNNGIVPTSTGVIALTPNTAGASVNFSTPGLASAYLGAVGTVSYDLGNHTPVGGAWKLGGGGGTLNLTNTAISGTDSVTIGNGVNGGTVVFNAANSYNGATVINPAATLRAGAANAFSPNSAMTVSNGAQVNLAGYDQAIGSLAGQGLVANTSNSMATLTVGDGTSTTFGGVMAGAQNLTKTGGGTLTLTNANVYSGATLVNAGTLQLSPTGPNQAGLIESFTNANLTWSPVGLSNIAVASYARWASVYLPGGSYLTAPVWGQTTWPTNSTIGYSGYIYNNSSSNVTWTFAMVLDDNARLLIDGVNVLTAGGTATYTSNVVAIAPGAHTIDLRLSNTGSNGGGGGGNYNLFGSAAYSSLGGFAYDPLGRGTANGAYFQVPVDSGNGTLFTSGLNILPASTVVQIATNATLDLNGAQQIITGLSDPNGQAGLGGLITNSQGAITAALTLNPQAGSNYLFTGNIADAGTANAISINLNGPGFQTLAGTNTYSGGTVINGGALVFGVSNAVPANSNITINANGAVAFDFDNTGNNLQTALAKVNGASTGIVAFTLNNASANFNFNAAGLASTYFGAISNQAFTGSVTPYGGVGNVTRLGALSGATLSYNTAINAGSVAIGGGLGTVAFTNGANGYTGTVINSGTLLINADSSLGDATTVPNTNVVFYGTNGVLAAANDLTLGANRALLMFTNSTMGTLNDNGYNLTVNGNVVGTGTLVKVGSGTTTLGGLTNTVFGIMARAGTLTFAPGSSNNIAGANNSTAYGLQVAPYRGDRAVVTFNPTAGQTNIILGSLRVGNAANSAGAVYQTGGLVLQNGANANQAFAIGSGGGYGYYELTGGTVVGSQIEISSVNTGAGGVGVMDIMGGTVTPSTYFIIGRSANGIGVVNVSGGGTLVAPINTSGISFGWDANTNGLGILNIFDGGVVNAARYGRALDLGANGAGNNGILNLNAGGTALVYQITRSQVGLGLLNFNGGLLIASNNAASTFINNNLTAANVYPGGANISNDVNVAILQALVAPIGYGVTGIQLLGGGTNYIGAPAIKLVGGNGTGATASAQIDADGVITNLLVTSPGIGYAASDVLTAQLLGGGATAAGTLGTVTLGANSSSGGLTKSGTGTLTLGGSNTFGGATIIGSGNLVLGVGGTVGTLANPSVTFSNTASWLGFNRSDIVTNGLAVQDPNGPIAAVVQMGYGTLVLTNTDASAFQDL